MPRINEALEMIRSARINLDILERTVPAVSLSPFRRIVEIQLDDAIRALEDSESEREPDAMYRKALENALIHTAHLPYASRDLLEGLLASVARICKEALGIDTARTPEPAGDSEPTDVLERINKALRNVPRSSVLNPNVRVVTAKLLEDAATALERLEALEGENAEFREVFEAQVFVYENPVLSPTDIASAMCAMAKRALATPAPAPQRGNE